MLPVTETDTIVVRSAAQVKDEPVEINLSSLQLRKRVFFECEDNISDEELAAEMPPQADPLLPPEDVPVGDLCPDSELGEPCVEYRKVIEEEMREYCTTEGCRRIVTMKYFNSPPSMRGTSAHDYMT